jgi:hypothetical protein
MAKHSSRLPPLIEGNPAFNEYMIELHEILFGDADNDGSLDGDNITGADDPGSITKPDADATYGTEERDLINETKNVVNDVITNLKATGILEE